MTTLDDNALRAAAGDYVAGDLAGDEESRFQAKLASDAALPREVAFWQTLRPAWHDGLTNEGLSESFAESVLARAARDTQDRHRVIRLPLWAMIVTSAAAAALAIVALVPAIPADAQMYAEDGAAMVATGPTGPWERYLPRALVSHVDSSGTGTTDMPHSRAWAGFWTRPVRFSQDGRPSGGHLVLRVAGGSPAYGVGLRPGDIILGIKDCAVSTPACIAHQLQTAAPRQRVGITWWRPETGEQFKATLVLETLYE